MLWAGWPNGMARVGHQIGSSERKTKFYAIIEPIINGHVSNKHHDTPVPYKNTKRKRVDDDVPLRNSKLSLYSVSRFVLTSNLRN